MSKVNTLQGEVQGFEQDGVYQFRGIPFAAPPCLGANRFQAPRPALNRPQTFQATQFSPRCPQIDPTLPPEEEPYFPGEATECLTLNIWSSNLNPTARLPVLVYIHGGSYQFGAGSSPLYEGTHLASKGVVYITINYRVGFEGFGHIPGQPENRGLLDQIAALQWIKANVANFGGDPTNMTVAGQSAGAGSILCLMCMPLTQGLFQRAILHSSPGLIKSMTTAKKVTKALAQKLKIEPTLQGFASIPPMALVRATLGMVATTPSHPEIWGPLSYSTTVVAPLCDGTIIPHPPCVPLSKAAASIDILIGYCRDEYAGLGLMLEPLGLKADPDTFAAAIGFPQAASEMKRLHPDMPPGLQFSELASDWLFKIPTVQVAAQHAALRNPPISNTPLAIASGNQQPVSKPHAGGTSSTSADDSSGDSGQQASHAGQTHVFQFAAVNPDHPKAPVTHDADLPFAYGNLDATFKGQRRAPRRSPHIEELSERFQRALVSFCQCGDPKWGCQGYTTASPIQRVWTLPDQQGQHEIAPLEALNQVWDGFELTPLEIPMSDS